MRLEGVASQTPDHTGPGPTDANKVMSGPNNWSQPAHLAGLTSGRFFNAASSDLEALICPPFQVLGQAG